jgi:serine/threonine protein kinase
MEAERWKLVDDLLQSALQVAPEQRDEFVNNACSGDSALAAEIKSLLTAYRRSEEFLDTPAMEIAARSIAHGAPATLVGQTFAQYRIVRMLGYGGMGSVWLAERSDGRFERQVAIKFLNVSMMGGGVERFKREGRILGQLAHPHIAELIDAGVTAAGEPYLVLEYVEGEHIDAYCDKNNLDVDARLKLFLDVLGAVAHAHSNLVVHRDIKPSNVLVRKDGQAKLLDFGIAKLLSDDTTPSPATVLSLEAGAVLTPQFAAPEQVTGGAVTTATDVYELGVLLYVLLTGQHPAGSGPHSPAELVNAIVQTEPPHASDAIAKTETKTLAETRATNLEKLRRQLRGDLDTILGKALKKDPNERYRSVTPLAEDLQRYLKHEPISARPDSIVYRGRKFLRRNRFRVLAAALALGVLIFGLFEINRERLISQRRFSDVRQLSNKLFDIDAQISELPGSSNSRQLIVNTALEYLRRLSSDVQGDPELTLEVGTAYMRVARVQGVPIGPNLGQMDEAEKSLRTAQDLVEAALKREPRNRTAMLRAAMIAHDRMILARFRGQYGEAVALARKAAERLEDFHPGKDDQADAPAILNTYLNVADQLETESYLDEALRICARGTELAKTFNNETRAAAFLATAANVLQQRADLDQALRNIQDAVTLLDPGVAWLTQGKRTHNFQLALVYEGRILGEDNSISLGRSAEAVQVLERAFQIADEFVHRDPSDQSSRGRLSEAGISLGDILRHSDPRNALTVYDHTLRHLAEIQNNENLQRYEVNLWAGSAYALQSLGRSAEAHRRLDLAFGRLKQLKYYPTEKIYPGSEVEEAVRALADLEAGEGRLQHALQIYEDLLRRIQPSRSTSPSLEDAVHLSAIFASAATLYHRAGRADLAASMKARRADLWAMWDQKLPHNAFVRHQMEAP